MKKLSCLILLSSALSLGLTADAEAIVINLGGSEAAFTDQQAIQVVIVDGNGNAVERTVNYNPSLGGIDIDASWAGPNASIYVPNLNQSYLFYNGYWIDQNGYYWNNGQRQSLNDPQWNTHWSHYWEAHPRDHWNWDRHQGDDRRWNRDAREGQELRRENREGREFKREDGFERNRQVNIKEEGFQNRPDFNRRDDAGKARQFEGRGNFDNKREFNQDRNQQMPGGNVNRNNFDRNDRRGENQRQKG